MSVETSKSNFYWEKECAAIEAELINYPKIINFKEPTPRVIKVVGNVKGCFMFLKIRGGLKAGLAPYYLQPILLRYNTSNNLFDR